MTKTAVDGERLSSLLNSGLLLTGNVYLLYSIADLQNICWHSVTDNSMTEHIAKVKGT